MTASFDLEKIETETDWPALVAAALAVPPMSGELADRLRKWSIIFSVVYDGEPLEADYPEPVWAFLRRLAFADVPPKLLEWVGRFEARRGRKPTEKEIPSYLRDLLPSDTKKGGRPRLDTKRWREARSAWIAASYQESYETRREILAFARKRKINPFNLCFGFPRMEIRGSYRPAELALQLLTKETGLSASRLADMMGHRRKK
jgi:hypothetical protein